MGVLAWLMEMFPQAADLLQYDRSAIAQGEFWRLFTGHWIHWNSEHFLWDVIVFVSLGALCESYSRKAFLACLAASALFISIAVWSVLPQMLYYRGLSGIDAALYLMAVVVFMRDKKINDSPGGIIYTALLLTAFLVKVGYELATGDAIFVQSTEDFVPVPVAHMAGAATGALVMLTSLSRNASKKTCKPARLI